jgi:hypothetical protein
MRKVRIVSVLGWVEFLYHICAGIGLYAGAEQIKRPRAEKGVGVVWEEMRG